MPPRGPGWEELTWSWAYTAGHQASDQKLEAAAKAAWSYSLLCAWTYGANGLSAKVQTVFEQQPFSGHVFVFRGRRGDIVKLLWWDGDGLCLFAKRLERGRFIWPQATEGTVCLNERIGMLATSDFPVALIGKIRELPRS
jgi:hypothetical protein